MNNASYVKPTVMKKNLKSIALMIKKFAKRKYLLLGFLINLILYKLIFQIFSQDN